MNLTCRFGLLMILTLSGISPLEAQRLVDPTRPLFSPPEPSISCGMTILPGRRSVDPKMPKAPPQGEFTLQVRTPTVCRDMSRLPPLRDSKNLPSRLPTFFGPNRQ
jgi:hypothetical protein